MATKRTPRGKARISKPRPVGGLLGTALPRDFAEQSARIEQMQAFFDTLETDPVFQQVRVLRVESGQVILGLPSPTLANYLRLYSRELSRQLGDQFGRHYELRIVVAPEAFYQSDEQGSRLVPAGRFSEDVCTRIKASAEAIDDDELKLSLLALARRIQR